MGDERRFMSIIIDKTKKLSECLTEEIKKVLIIYWHGLGDLIMFLAPFNKLKELYPKVHFDIGLCKGLDQETIVPDAILLEGDWREKCIEWDYDIVFVCNFPLEDIKDETKTKAEICCEQELGIPLVSDHIPLETKGIVGVTFQMTSVPWVANADQKVAQKIWNDIKECGYTPVEVLMQHCFHNPENKMYDFIDNNLRGWPARIQTLMAILKGCDYFIGVVSGNFHLALSLLGKDKVMLLEKDLKSGHFTKDKIATANLKNYNNEVKDWLLGIGRY